METADYTKHEKSCQNTVDKDPSEEETSVFF